MLSATSSGSGSGSGSGSNSSSRPDTALASKKKDLQHLVHITRACDVCRKKKIKCEPLGGDRACAQCVKSKSVCHFTPICMKRSPKRSIKDKRFEELEQRLKMMESQLKNAVASQQNDTGIVESDGGYGSVGFPKLGYLERDGYAHSSGGHSDEFMGSASTMSDSSPQTLDFGPSTYPSENIFTSDAGDQRAIYSHDSHTLGRRAKIGHMKKLPTGEHLRSMVEASFHGFYPAFPLFDQTAFMSTLDSLGTSFDRPDWWACVNVVLAMTPQFRDATDHDEEENREAWGYFQNAFAVANQLMTMHLTLWSVQALLGMAIVILGTSNQGPVSLLVSAAIKLAQKMNLHRRCDDPRMSDAEIEERQCVFWIAYTLDKELSLQMGQPPAQDDDDMDIAPLPGPDIDLPYPIGCSSSDFFSFRAKLAIIQGHMYKRLRSVGAMKQSIIERDRAVKDLGNMLESWRASVPLKYMRDYDGPPVRIRNWGADKHPIILQLLYFNTLAMIHNSTALTPVYRDLKEPGIPLEVQYATDPLVFPAEARKAVKLLRITPRRRGACLWAVLHIFIKAATTLLNHVVDNPSAPLVLVDISLVEPLLGVLYSLSQGRDSERVIGMYQSIMKQFELAKSVVESANVMSTDWQQHPTTGALGEREDVESFLRRIENMSWPHVVDSDSSISVEHSFIPG